MFHLQSGKIKFHRKNFHPTGELFVFAVNPLGLGISSYLPFSPYLSDIIPEPQNEWERKLLKNLPYARRGYIFQNKELKAYFEAQDWYIAKPEYVPEPEFLWDLERKWLNQIQ